MSEAADPRAFVAIDRDGGSWYDPIALEVLGIADQIRDLADCLTDKEGAELVDAAAWTVGEMAEHYKRLRKIRYSIGAYPVWLHDQHERLAVMAAGPALHVEKRHHVLTELADFTEESAREAESAMCDHLGVEC